MSNEILLGRNYLSQSHGVQREKANVRNNNLNDFVVVRCYRHARTQNGLSIVGRPKLGMPHQNFPQKRIKHILFIGTDKMKREEELSDYSDNNSDDNGSVAGGETEESVSSRDEMKELQKLVDKENRSISVWRVVVSCAIVLVGAGVTWMTHRFLSTDEENNFKKSVSAFHSRYLQRRNLPISVESHSVIYP